MLSRIFGGLIVATMLAGGLGVVAAAPASAAAAECGTLRTEQLGSSLNEPPYTYLGKTYHVNVTVFGEYDPNFGDEVCDLKLVMKVTVPSGGVVTTGHVNLQTNAHTVNTTRTNDIVGGTKTYDSGWLGGNCMITGLGLWIKPGTSVDTQYLTSFGNGTTCF